MTRAPSIAVAILAGGEGSRIGGEKPQLLLAGRSLAERAHDRARGWSEMIVLSLRSAEQVRMPDLASVTDAVGIEGPLAGVVAALDWAQAQGAGRLLTIPCDMPFLPEDLLEKLEEAIGDERAAVASSGGRLHPVCALWRTDVLEFVPAYLSSGRRSLHGLAAHAGFVSVDWPAGPPDPFFNINRPEDLVEAELMLDR